MTNGPLAGAVVALLGEHGGAWQGTAGELLALLPGVAADATRLARALGDAEGELAAAGVTLARRRAAGTGARLLVLRLGGVTLAGGMLVNAGISEPERRAGAAAGLLRHTAHASEAADLCKPEIADVRKRERDPVAVIFGDAVAAALRRR